MLRPDTYLKHYDFAQVNEATHRVFGPVMTERIDSDNEIADFEQHKGAYQRWSDKALAKTSAAGQDPSLGNIRIQHDPAKIGGKATRVDANDQEKTMRLESEPVDDDTWHMLKGGFLTGYSQGGQYLWRKCETCGGDMPRKVGANYCAKCKKNVVVRYGSELSEVSYVDVPANDDAAFEYVRADGTKEMRKFATPGIARLSESDVSRIVKALRADMEKGVRYLIPAGTEGGDGKDHLPVTDEGGKVSHRLMGAAWAALHGGYRGNKYEGPGKQKAIERLTAMYRSEGMETPSAKAVKMIADLSEKVPDPEVLFDLYDDEQGSDFDTHLEKFCRIVADLIKDTATGEPKEMNKEQIQKCAAALGITPEEFEKQFVQGDALEKGKKGLAALHAHLTKAIAHHEKMSAHHDKMGDMHKAHAEMHKDHAEHLQNCMKAHGACMDGDEAEKVLKALGIPAEPEKKETLATGVTADDVTKAVNLAVEAALKKQAEEFDKKLEKTIAPMGKENPRLVLIGRDGKEINADAAAAKGDPIPA